MIEFIMASYPEDHVIEERGAVLRAREVAVLTERERIARLIEGSIHENSDKKVREALRKQVDRIRSGPKDKETLRNRGTAEVFIGNR